MYFWDTFTWATLHALLDPVNMKNMLRRWLELNIHSCYAQDMVTGHGVGPWYSFNDFVVFNQFITYIKTTGDTEFLNEIIRGRPVIEQLEQMSLWWKRLVKPYSPLADYGGRSNLLECVPTYTHVVASLNAANVWMMRQTAELRHRSRQTVQAEALSQQPKCIIVHVPGRSQKLLSEIFLAFNVIFLVRSLFILPVPIEALPGRSPMYGQRGNHGRSTAEPRALRSRRNAMPDREFLYKGCLRKAPLRRTTASDRTRPRHHCDR